MAKNNDLKEEALEYIDKCHVVPLVHAKEGGVIYLEELLMGFAKSDKVKAYHNK